MPLEHPLGTWECTWITLGSPSFYLALSQVSALKCTIMTLSGTECTVPSALAHNRCTPYLLCTFLSSALIFYLSTTAQHSALQWQLLVPDCIERAVSVGLTDTNTHTHTHTHLQNVHQNTHTRTHTKHKTERVQKNLDCQALISGGCFDSSVSSASSSSSS